MDYLCLETDNLVLRKANEGDLESIWQNLWFDDDVAKYMLWKSTKTKAEAIDRLKRSIKYQSENYAYFVCLKETNEAIGMAGIWLKESNIYSEAGISIGKKYQGLGYGKEILGALIDLVFNKLKGKRFLYSCFRENVISQKLCKHFRFQYLESKERVRDYDNKKFIEDVFYLDK